jgi:hypothetical protein
MSEETVSCLKKVMADKNELEINKKIATILISHEHQFQELIAGRRMLEYSLLDALEDISWH